MPFTSAFECEGIEKVIGNILAYIEDHNAEALKWANGEDGALPEFQKIYNNSIGRVHTNYPDLTVTNTEEEDELQGDGSLSEVTHSFGFEMTITDSDPDRLTLRTYRYVRAIRAMLRKMKPEEITAGMESVAGGTVTRIRANHDETRGGGSLYARVPKMFVQVKLWEGKENA